jgi:hypothetical protein
MRLFDIIRANDNLRRRLVQTILLNAYIIQKTEFKSRREAEYLSICTLLDSLRTQTGGENARAILITIVERAYPQHLRDVLEFSDWLSGRRKLGPQEEAAMERRHAKSPLAGSNDMPKLGVIGGNAKRALIAIAGLGLEDGPAPLAVKQARDGREDSGQPNKG